MYALYTQTKLFMPINPEISFRRKKLSIITSLMSQYVIMCKIQARNPDE
jgi:hypothetical protein